VGIEDFENELESPKFIAHIICYYYNIKFRANESKDMRGMYTTKSMFQTSKAYWGVKSNFLLVNMGHYTTKLHIFLNFI